MDTQSIAAVAQRVRGMQLQEAKDLIRTEGMVFRVLSEDGLQFSGSSDHVPYRINLEVIDGVVREARVG